MENYIPVADYFEHPAFKEHIVNREISDSALSNAIGEIESGLNQVYELANAHKDSAALTLFKRLDSKFELLKTEIEKIMGEAVLKETVIKTVDVTRAFLQNEVKYILRGSKNKPRFEDEYSKSIVKGLEENGCTSVNINKEQIDKIKGWLHSEISLLYERRDQGIKVRNNVPVVGEKLEKINRFFTSHRAMDAINAYNGRRMRISSCAVELSDESSAWHRDCYADKGLKSSKTTYFHVDYEYYYQKAIMYLSDVNADTGPFSFVPKSHTWKRPYFRYVFFKELDMAITNFISRAQGKKSDYYRPIFISESGRKSFMEIPKLLQGSSHFGDDLIDGSADSEFLLKNEKVFTSKDGNLIIFNGSRGIHRGGLVKKGSRLVLYISMIPATSFLQKVVSSVKYRLFNSKG